MAQRVMSRKRYGWYLALRRAILEGRGDDAWSGAAVLKVYEEVLHV